MAQLLPCKTSRLSAIFKWVVYKASLKSIHEIVHLVKVPKVSFIAYLILSLKNPRGKIQFIIIGTILADCICKMAYVDLNKVGNW